MATVRAGNGYHADLHEIRLTPEGTAWIDAFDPIKMNLSKVHGVANGVLTDSVVQEIDVKTGLVMWEWHALGHVPIGESFNAVPRIAYPWDYIHINSVDPGSSGDVLLSARNMWTLYDVDLQSGLIRWRLGGHHSSFKLGPGVPFYWQHDAEFQPGGMISVFDNGSDPPKEKQSRGLLLSVNEAGHSVSLVKAFTNPSKTLLASSQGNTLSLPGGNWLMGYGGLPNFTEYDSAGHVLLDGTLGRNVQDFRTYLAPWSAHGEGSPAVAARPGSGGHAVGVGQLERRHQRGQLARARGRHRGLAGGGRDGAEQRLRDDDRGPRRRGPVRRRAGARLLRDADRHLGARQGLRAGQPGRCHGWAGRGSRRAGGLLAALILLAVRGRSTAALRRRCVASSAGAELGAAVGLERRRVPACPQARTSPPRSRAGASRSPRRPKAATPPRPPRSACSGRPQPRSQQLVVRGSRTGVHAGRLAPFSQGDGGSFLPSRPFAEGETVSVSARLQLGQPASPVPVSWSFTVAARDVTGHRRGQHLPRPRDADLHQSFVSRPDLRPPTVTVTRGARARPPGTCSSLPTRDRASTGR